MLQKTIRFTPLCLKKTKTYIQMNFTYLLVKIKIKKRFVLKIANTFLLIILTFTLGAQKNHIIQETNFDNVLLSLNQV